MLTVAVLALSGLPASLAGLLGLAVHARLRRWRPSMARRATVSPDAVTLTLEDHRELTVEAPFRALVRPGWLALHCPGRGWVWLFADQVPPAALTALRQVLWLQRR